MNRNWDDIKWIFEPDGSLRDIYVQDISISDWSELIDLLNQGYNVQYGTTGETKNPNKIDKEYVLKYLTDETGELESRSVTINLDGIKANCHFFLPNQIEIDLDPKEINSIEDFDKIEKFMEEISQTLSTQVTLTAENTPEFPLVKIDKLRDLNKVLTEKEAKELRGSSNFLKNQIGLLKIKLKMALFPGKFKEQLFKSANEPYTSTKKNKNVW